MNLSDVYQHVLNRKSLFFVVFVIWHLNVAQCLRQSLTIDKTVATVLEVNECHLPGLGIFTDNFLKIIYDLIELVVVDVPVML